ncbi:acetyltransferase [Altericista sp. CCNU0014]|uniref:acetyltransferase n=1 Tax=Altericista sp. CCNU0014 TaxID=3082949 RepID=UPI00384F8ED7
MFLKHRLNRDLVEVLNVAELWDPFVPTLLGRYHAGEELQDPELFSKVDLMFLSDELLPQCWIDPHYRDRQVLGNESGKVLTR